MPSEDLKIFYDEQIDYLKKKWNAERNEALEKIKEVMIHKNKLHPELLKNYRAKKDRA